MGNETNSWDDSHRFKATTDWLSHLREPSEISRPCPLWVHRVSVVSISCGRTGSGNWAFRPPVRCYFVGVPLLRILVDGFSLLHAWPELAPGRARHSAAAREALIQQLTQYHDATGTPVTIFFDGSGAPKGTPQTHSTREVEVLYSRAGQTADDMIERAAYRLSQLGEVLVVTNDFAERDTVNSFGGMAQSCENFLRMIGEANRDLTLDLKEHNRRERVRFKQPH